MSPSIAICALVGAASASTTDSAFDGFHAPNNPSQGTLGTWSYGYFEPGDVFTALPNLVTNGPVKLHNWQLQPQVGGGIPRITRNFGNVDKTYTNVVFPASDFLVLKPKNTNAVVLRFTPDTTATYLFDATFAPMRTANASSTVVSMELAGIPIGGCSGNVDGLVTTVGAELVCAAVSIALTAGEPVDFVVDANGGTANYDDIGVQVDVLIDGDGDGDGLVDSVEAALGIDPGDADSDDDLLSDGDEVNLHLTDALDDDSDDDLLSDGDEVLTYSTDPLALDTDVDGLSDGDEFLTYTTDPLASDSDLDGLSDGDEVLSTFSDPLASDTDLDGLSDGDEVLTHTTDPLDIDTDVDGLSDGDEVLTYSTDPLDTDTDLDALTDGDEVLTYGTDPLDVDSDGGGLHDGEEVLLGGDPLDASDDVAGDDAEDAFTTGFNPSQGALGQWSYGYYEPGDVFTQLPVFSVNAPAKLETWQATAIAGSAPRVTNNYHTANKTWTNVMYPADDYLVVRPKANRPVVVRFSADAAGDYRFDTTFRSMRTAQPASTLVSVEQGGSVVDGCAGSVGGLVTDLSGNEVRCEDVTATLAAGETVEFVVEANGTDANDETGLRVEVYASSP